MKLVLLVVLWVASSAWVVKQVNSLVAQADLHPAAPLPEAHCLCQAPIPRSLLLFLGAAQADAWVACVVFGFAAAHDSGLRGSTVATPVLAMWTPLEVFLQVLPR